MLKKLFTTEPIGGSSFVLLFLRIAVSGFMLTHGYPKLLRLFGEEQVKFSDPFGIGAVATLALAVFAEFFCSVFLILGFATRFCCLMLAITMAVAAFHAHGGDPFSTKEKALLFLIIYLTLLFLGAGKYSIDHTLFRKR